MLSIISMLSGPNDESPANVEAAVSVLYQLAMISTDSHTTSLDSHIVLTRACSFNHPSRVFFPLAERMEREERRV